MGDIGKIRSECNKLLVPCSMETVKLLIFWRDPIKSAIVFGLGFVVLLIVATWSFVALAAYVALIALAICNLLRLYQWFTARGKSITLEKCPVPTLSWAQLEKFTRAALPHLNAFLFRAHHLYICADYATTLKYAALLWLLTYLGVLFSAATLLLISFVFLFTVPKLYVDYRSYFDRQLDFFMLKMGLIFQVDRLLIGRGQVIADPIQQESDF